MIPVAILSSPTFDARLVNPATVTLNGAKVKLTGKAGKFHCSAQDVNGDGLVDLLCYVETNQFVTEPGSAVAVLKARTTTNRPIRGEDSIQIVPHRYAPEHRHMEPTSGIYNVEWVTFKRDRQGLEKYGDVLQTPRHLDHEIRVLDGILGQEAVQEVDAVLEVGVVGCHVRGPDGVVETRAGTPASRTKHRRALGAIARSVGQSRRAGVAHGTGHPPPA